MKIQPTRLLANRLLANGTVQFGRDLFSRVTKPGSLSENKVDGAGHGSIKKKPSFHGFIFENNPNFTSLRKVIEQLTSSFRNQGFGHFGFPKIGGQIGSSLTGIGQLFSSLKNQSFGSSFEFPQIGSPLTGIGDIIRTIGSIKNSIGNIRNLF
jgi:hypothetical protein